MATRSWSGKILSFVFAAVAVAMVLESSTSVPGSKCLWNNVVSTLIWRVLSQPRGISPGGRGKSRGRYLAPERRGGDEGVHDGPSVVRRRGSQGIEGRRHGGHDRPGAGVGQAHMEPGESRRLRFTEREYQQVHGGPAPAPHMPPHGKPAAPESLGDTLAQGVAPRDEDLVPSQRGGLLVAGGGGAGEDRGVHG